jgi:hypothetical protein
MLARELEIAISRKADWSAEDWEEADRITRAKAARKRAWEKIHGPSSPEDEKA